MKKTILAMIIWFFIALVVSPILGLSTSPWVQLLGWGLSVGGFLVALYFAIKDLRDSLK